MALTKTHNRMLSGAVISAFDYDGDNAGEQIANAIDGLPVGGGVIDARGFTGTQTIASDIFASRTTPFTLLLGEAIFEIDLTSYGLSLNSNQQVILNGTTCQPSTSNPTGFSTTASFFRSNITETTGTISASSASLVLASVAGLEVGSLVAVNGASGVNTNSQTTLSSTIDGSVTTIPLVDASDLPATYTVFIGSEIIIGTEKSGNDLINVTRGVYGTSPVGHTSGDTVSLSPYFRAVVESIAGTTVTLSGNATTAVTSARVLYGITNSSVSGIGIIDGRSDRTIAAPAKNSFGIFLNLATRFTIGDDLVFRKWDHGGVHLQSSWSNYVGGRYYANSRPADSTGANLWLFRNSSFNVVNIAEMTDSYVGLYIDDRTSSANLYDGPSNKNTISLPFVSATTNAIEISGSNNNTIVAGFVQSTSSTAISVATNSQGSTLRSADSNTIRVGAVSGSPAAASIRNSNNYIEIGSTDGGIDVASTCDSYVSVKDGTSAGEYLGSAVVNPTWFHQAKEGGAIRIASTEVSMVADEEIGRFEVYGSEASSPGAGVKGAITVEAAGGTGGSSQMKFSISNGTDGNDFDVIAIDAAGSFFPMVSGTPNLGGGSNLWNTVYAATGTINTSDENYKQDIRDISVIESKVATSLKGKMKAFRFKDSVISKGDEARIHFGAIAQVIESEFKAEGLDPNSYGLFCKDIWREYNGKPVTVNENNKYVTSTYADDGTKTFVENDTVEASRLGVRYEELFAFIISTL